MYKITREEASLLLNLSTRSIDRYIRGGKLRSKKEGKIVYINQDDINNFLGKGVSKIEIMTENEVKSENDFSISIKDDEKLITRIYDDLKNDIKFKDKEINSLNIKIGMMEEIVKNSIPVIDFKKSQFLLEESKISLSSELTSIKKDLESKIIELNQEKKLNYITIFVSIILFITVVIIWIVKI